MKNQLRELYPPEKLLAQFETLDQFQNFMDDLFNERSILNKKVLDYTILQNKQQDDIEKNTALLKEYNAQINDLENFIKTASSQKLIKEYNARLFRVTQRRDNVLEDLKSSSYSTQHLNSVMYAHYLNGIEGIDEWADELGKWFESGALGPGNVTYGDKTYSYE